MIGRTVSAKRLSVLTDLPTETDLPIKGADLPLKGRPHQGRILKYLSRASVVVGSDPEIPAAIEEYIGEGELAALRCSPSSPMPGTFPEFARKGRLGREDRHILRRLVFKVSTARQSKYRDQVACGYRKDACLGIQRQGSRSTTALEPPPIMGA